MKNLINGAALVVGLIVVSPSSYAQYLSNLLPHSFNQEIIYSGDQENGLFAWSVSSAGDINSDGYDDFIMGSPFHNGNDFETGKVTIIFGGVTNLTQSTLNFTQRRSHFGSSMSAGDINGDGYSDIAISAPSFDNGEQDEGAVFIYLGGNSGVDSDPHLRLESNQENPSFGRALDAKGDLNGDGFSDLVIGAENYSNGEPNEGVAFVYYGSQEVSQQTHDALLELNIENAGFGSQISSSGDFNADGYDDLVVSRGITSVPELSGGLVAVYYGSIDGIKNEPDIRIEPPTLENNYIDDRFGSEINHAGDINGDGYGDLIIRGGTFQNQVFYIYFGNANGVGMSNDQRIDIVNFALSSNESSIVAGDFNGDGFGDILIGSLKKEEPAEGLSLVYFGTQNGLDIDNINVLEQKHKAGFVGRVVSNAGDVDGDEVDDIIIGSAYFYSVAADAGEAILYLSNVIDSDMDGIPDYLDGNPFIPNAAPLIDGAPSSSINQDEAYIFIPSIIDDGDTNTISVTAQNLPEWLLLDEVTGEINGEPSNEEVGIYDTITLTVSDGYLSTTLAAFNIEVINLNDPPVYNGNLQNISISVGSNITLNLKEYFSDVDAGDSLLFSSTGLPPGITISSAGTASGNSSNVGSYNIVITATDGSSESVQGIFTISILQQASDSSNSTSGGSLSLYILLILPAYFLLRIRGRN